MKCSLLKVFLSATPHALLASEQEGVDRAGLSTCLFFSLYCCWSQFKKNKKNKIIIAHIYFMLLGADALEGSLIISFDMYSYPMSGHYYPDVHVGKLRYRVTFPKAHGEKETTIA